LVLPSPRTFPIILKLKEVVMDFLPYYYLV
jgi:hypothetical protein